MRVNYVTQRRGVGSGWAGPSAPGSPQPPRRVRLEEGQGGALRPETPAGRVRGLHQLTALSPHEARARRLEKRI